MKKLILLLLVATLSYSCTTEEVTIRGTVVAHASGYHPNYHDITYRTIIKRDDGEYEEKEGFNLYAMPVGTRVSYKETKIVYGK